MFSINQLNDLANHLANRNVRCKSIKQGKENIKPLKSYYTSRKPAKIVSPYPQVPPSISKKPQATTDVSKPPPTTIDVTNKIPATIDVANKLTATIDVTKPPPATIDVSSLLNKLQKKGLLDRPENGAKITLESYHPSMKARHTDVVSQLYDNLPIKCTTCALRFSGHEEAEYKSHLDWHFRANGRKKQKKSGPESRAWYQPSHVNVWQEDTFHKKDEEETEGRQEEEEKVEKVLVEGEESSRLCPECLEGFKLVYSEEEEDGQWLFMHAVKVGDQIYHSQCYTQTNNLLN